MTTRKIPKYNVIDDLILSLTFLPECVRTATKYKPRPDDVLVATYPKCGTTWMCQIALLIQLKGQLPLTTEDIFERWKFLEYDGAEIVENMTRPGCIKTHLPFNRITFSSKAKYIYVTRHPSDCVVSFYHHTKLFPTYYFTDGTFDDFFELFVRGEIDFNDYFDNLLSWYEHRNDPNVFFTTYEKMKADHRGTVLKVAEFLGEEYQSALSENNYQLLDEIVYKSSFSYMKQTTNKMFTDCYTKPSGREDPLSKLYDKCLERAKEQGEKSIGEFIRTGQIGEGKIVLSVEQKQRLEARILEKTKGSDVMSLWNE